MGEYIHPKAPRKMPMMLYTPCSHGQRVVSYHNGLVSHLAGKVKSGLTTPNMKRVQFVTLREGKVVWWCIWARNFATNIFAIEMRSRLAAAIENPFMQSTRALQEPTWREFRPRGGMHKVPYGTTELSRRQGSAESSFLALFNRRAHAAFWSLDFEQHVFLMTRLCC